MMKMNRNLYVVDDDKIYHFLFKNLLKQNNIDINSTFFNNGLDAIEFMLNHNEKDNLPDILLLDINMPIMNGWQFLEEFVKVKNDLSKSPVIYMISSSNNEVDISKAREFNGIVADYFLKPIKREDLNTIFVENAS